MVPNSEAFNSLIGDGFQIPELKDESEASGGYRAVVCMALDILCQEMYEEERRRGWFRL